MSSSCSRGSIYNPASGRCKACNSFTLAELKSIAKTQRVSQAGTKQDLCNRLVKHFTRKIGKIRSLSKSKSRSSSSRKKRSSSHKKRSSSRKRPVKRVIRRSKSVKRRAPSRSSSYYRSKAPRVVKTRLGRSRVHTYSYPTKGRGSFQKRHFSSTRKGPSLPAQAHRHESKRGNDGNMWRSVPDKNGVFHWRRV
jgi:hypothetical protein